MYLLPDLSWDHTPMLFGSDEYMEKLVLFSMYSSDPNNIGV
jgi:hypothetical protein